MKLGLKIILPILLLLLVMLSSFGYLLYNLNQQEALISRVIIVLSFVVIVTAILLYFYLRVVITKPIIRLATIADQIAHADFDTSIPRIDIFSNDEIGKLAESFRTMSKNLHQIYQDLRQANARDRMLLVRERELDRSKDEFLSIAAHQLRTPLGITRWNSERLLSGKKGELSASVKETITDISISNLRLIALVNDLLDVSRINQGRVQNKPEPIDLVHIIEHVSADMGVEAEQKKITINFDKPKKPIVLLLDPKLLRQVVQNLLSNAIKYNHPNNTIEITIKLTDTTVTVQITDHGIGIPKKDLPNIFNKFYRGSNAVKTNTEGTGLGLFMVQSYINQWKGKIWFDTIVDKGTSVYIELPITGKKLA